MYRDAAARCAQIERDGERDDAWLLGEAAAASGRLAEALASMDGPDWDATVRTAMGREVRAVEVPWMRIRESVVHALDLDLGATPDGWEATLVDALLTDTCATVGARDGCPAVLLVPEDRERTWQLGPHTEPVTVTAPATDLLLWVTGRSRAILPELPRWL